MAEPDMKAVRAPVEPCQQYRQAAQLVHHAAELLDPTQERYDCEALARRLDGAAQAVHEGSCLYWGRR